MVPTAPPKTEEEDVDVPQPDGSAANGWMTDVGDSKVSRCVCVDIVEYSSYVSLEAVGCTPTQ